MNYYSNTCSIIIGRNIQRTNILSSIGSVFGVFELNVWLAAGVCAIAMMCILILHNHFVHAAFMVEYIDT
jgi:hypothetical protein